MLICETKSGKFLEMQSDAIPGTLLQNAINAGYEVDDVIEYKLDEAGWKAMKAHMQLELKRKNAPIVEQENRINAEIRKMALERLGEEDLKITQLQH